MNRGLSIRPMRVQDLPRVMRIENASYSTPWTEATFRGLIRRRDVDLLVAEAEGELVGHAIFWVVIDQGELGNIAVAPEWRHRGIATRLLDAVIARAHHRGVGEIFLEVRASNRIAQKLYESHGFRQTGRRRNYYASPVEDALVLRKMMVE